MKHITLQSFVSQFCTNTTRDYLYELINCVKQIVNITARFRQSTRQRGARRAFGLFYTALTRIKPQII